MDMPYVRDYVAPDAEMDPRRSTPPEGQRKEGLERNNALAAVSLYTTHPIEVTVKTSINKRYERSVTYPMNQQARVSWLQICPD
jgi:hypothetical protein